MIGYRRVLLAPVPIAVHAVEAAMERIDEAVTRSVIRELSGKHRAAAKPTVVRASAVGHDLIDRIFVAESDDCVVLRVRSQMERRRTAFHIAAGECVAIALQQIDSDCSAHGIAAARRASDVKSYERAGVNPIGRCWIRRLMPDCIHGCGESVDLKVDGDVVTGTVHIGPWPGDAPIADGKVDGDRITFTATGSLSSTTGIPTCQFAADVHNGEMILTMTAIRNAGGPLRPGAVYEYRGGKQGD